MKQAIHNAIENGMPSLCRMWWLNVFKQVYKIRKPTIRNGRHYQADCEMHEKPIGRGYTYYRIINSTLGAQYQDSEIPVTNFTIQN